MNVMEATPTLWLNRDPIHLKRWIGFITKNCGCSADRIQRRNARVKTVIENLFLGLHSCDVGALTVRDVSLHAPNSAHESSVVYVDCSMANMGLLVAKWLKHLTLAGRLQVRVPSVAESSFGLVGAQQFTRS